MSESATLRQLANRDEILVCPGVHDPLTARVVDLVGFDAVYMTGFGTSLAQTGYPDVGLVTMPEMTENARKIDAQVDVPVFCDADNGYGDVKNVIRTVEEYLHTGVSGIHIEDQTTPKRGVVGGHRVIPEDEFVEKIRAASAVRDEHDEDFVIIARSDAPGAENGTLDDAIDRLNAAVDAGADMGFVVGQASEEDVKRVGEEVDAPLVYDWNGEHPQIEPATLDDYGYDIVICPLLGAQATMLSLYERAQQFKEQGPSVTVDMMEEFDELEEYDFEDFVGFPQMLEWEEKFKHETEAPADD